MKAFDFDGTLYRGDCTVDFYLWCLRKRPKCVFALPKQMRGAFRFALKRIDRNEWKEAFYSFLAYLVDADVLISEFWRSHSKKLNKAVLGFAEEGDVVISASPSFLLCEPCTALGLRLIASEVDRSSGKLLGPNCRGEEKVHRFRSEFGPMRLGEFYTDSLVDTPMMKLAERSYVVHGSRIDCAGD